MSSNKSDAPASLAPAGRGGGQRSRFVLPGKTSSKPATGQSTKAVQQARKNSSSKVSEVSRASTSLDDVSGRRALSTPAASMKRSREEADLSPPHEAQKRKDNSEEISVLSAVQGSLDDAESEEQITVMDIGGDASSTDSCSDPNVQNASVKSDIVNAESSVSNDVDLKTKLIDPMCSTTIEINCLNFDIEKALDNCVTRLKDKIADVSPEHIESAGKCVDLFGTFLGQVGPVVNHALEVAVNAQVAPIVKKVAAQDTAIHTLKKACSDMQVKIVDCAEEVAYSAKLGSMTALQSEVDAQRTRIALETP